MDFLIDWDKSLTILKEKQHPPSMRLDALLFLVSAFEPENVTVFADFAKRLQDENEHPDIRSAAALALAKVGQWLPDQFRQPALETLLPYVHAEDITVKNYVVQALGILGHQDAVPMLIEALKDDCNEVFSSAADSLGRMGRSVVPHLLTLLETGAEDARCVAAWKLGELRYIEAIPALVEAIAHEKNPDVQNLCIWALGEIGLGNPAVTDVLQWAKAQPSADVRRRAALAMKKIARHCN